MGFDHRKLLYKPTIGFGNARTGCFSCCYQDENNKEQCFFPRSKRCPPSCACLVLRDATPVIRPSSKGLPPPVVPLPHDNDTSLRELAIAGLTILACVVIAALLFCLLCGVGRAFYLRRNRSRRRNRPIIFDTQENFFDEDHGPEVDHHIWYINTVGLPHSIIDSITVFKYKKDEGLIDGTECSVCLNEFEEDESLRLLPKCSHAFHIPCIDTWLRSHKNCPLCRAPIISGAVVAQASESGSSSGGLDSRNENMVQSLGNYSGEGSNDLEEGGTSDIRIGHDSNSALSSDEEASAAESSNKSFPSRLKTRNGDSDSRVLSDLTDNRRGIEGDMQPMRRSVSLDSPSALMIYNDIAGGGVPDKHQGSVDTQIVNSKNLKSNSVSKRGSGSSSISKLMKSASIGIGTSLQKGPILMKRSFSSGRKVSSSRHGRRHSIIPLQK